MPSLRRTPFKPHVIFLPNDCYSFLSFSLTDSIHLIQETSHWTVSPLIRDSFSMIGSAVGGTTSAFYGFNLVMPIVQRRIKGPMWLHFLIGAPPVIVFSSACAGLAGGAVPAAAQLVSSSYHAAYPPPSKDEYIQKSIK